jgi:hypothetical protein
MKNMEWFSYSLDPEQNCAFRISHLNCALIHIIAVPTVRAYAEICP